MKRPDYRLALTTCCLINTSLNSPLHLVCGASEIIHYVFIRGRAGDGYIVFVGMIHLHHRHMVTVTVKYVSQSSSTEVHCRAATNYYYQ